MAWVRLAEDDDARDTSRLLFLLDVLARSYSALRDELMPVPALALGVHIDRAFGLTQRLRCCCPRFPTKRPATGA